MRLSGFNIYVEDYPTQDEILIHNTFSGGFVVLDRATLSILRKADRQAPLTECEQPIASDPDFFDPDVGICVESLEAEEEAFAEWFERRRSDVEQLEAMVCINLACNFECPYCAQAEVMDGTTMTHETAHATTRWLAQRAKTAGLPNVSLTFVGGEPLLHPERIEHIVQNLRAELDGQVRFTLITNGYFLDAAMLDRLVPLGLTGAQITLDGNEDTHPTSRVSKKGENSFRRVFDHTVAASHRIRISVNGNYQDHTLHGFGPLIDQLKSAGLAPTSRLRFSPALEALSSSAGVGSGTCSFSGSNTRYQVAFHDHIVGAGFDSPALHTLGPCSFHDRHSYAIDVDGTVLACPGFLGHRDWGIGHVETGLTTRYDALLNVNAQRACTGCAHRPNCGGGCVAATWLKEDRPEGVNCEKGYFESVIEPGVIREYVKATGSPWPEPEPLPPNLARRRAALRVMA